MNFSSHWHKLRKMFANLKVFPPQNIYHSKSNLAWAKTHPQWGHSSTAAFLPKLGGNQLKLIGARKFN